MATAIDRTATLDHEMFATLEDELGHDGLASLVDLFSKRSQVVNELDDATRSRDGMAIARLAHSLKGGAATLAAPRLASLASALEECGRRESYSTARLLTREAGVEFDRAVAEMNATLDPAHV